MKNVVFLLALPDENGPPPYAEYSIASWKSWVKNDPNRELFIYDTPLQEIAHLPPVWQRWHVLEILEKNDISFDQVLLTDADIIVRWDCPDIFSKAKGKFAAVSDPSSLSWVLNSIRTYQPLFPGIQLDWTEYFNAGLVVLNKKHRPFLEKCNQYCLENLEELRHYSTFSGWSGIDQTPLNYLIKRERLAIEFLSKKFNLLTLDARCILKGLAFIEYGYIWHFNGMTTDERMTWMGKTWESVREFYE